MNNKMYFCPNCSYKSNTTQGLLSSNKKGCSSCGKSNFKCPRCGMFMKIKKNDKIPDSNKNRKIKEKRGFSEKPVKVVKIKRY